MEAGKESKSQMVYPVDNRDGFGFWFFVLLYYLFIMKTLLINTICFPVFYIIPRALWDNYQIKQGKKIDHARNAIMSILVVSSYAWLDKNILMVPYLLFLYWLLFDLLLNKLRKKALLFVGTTAWLDRSFRKISPQNPGIEMLVCKIICLMVSFGWLLIKK